MVKGSQRYNDLSGKEWLRYSFSIWRDVKKSAEERGLKHPAIFPYQLVSRIIDIYTKKNEVVLDPFMGFGSTLVASKQKGRKAIGIDLSKEYVATTKERLRKIEGCHKKHNNTSIYTADARLLDKYVKKSSVNLCVTSPPYWDILNMRRSADMKKNKKYGNSKIDLGNIKSYDEFLDELKIVFEKVYKVLKKGGHCIVILMDIRKKDKFFPFHSDLADKMKDIGFEFEDLIIWDRQHEYNNMKPLGYPYVFRINKVHEYIMIFRKKKIINE